MSDDIWKPHVTVATIAERNGEYLLVEELNSLGEKVINQPAGHLDEGETLIEACVRETLEETGWAFTPEALVGIYRWISPRDGETFLRYSFSGQLIEQVSPEPLDSAILRTRWLSREQLDDPSVELRSILVTHCIDDYLKGSRYPMTLMSDVLEPTVA
jgi:ADP-ribose pyrophosphatase YjhB (NUDIX family)